MNFDIVGFGELTQTERGNITPRSDKIRPNVDLNSHMDTPAMGEYAEMVPHMQYTVKCCRISVTKKSSHPFETHQHNDAYVDKDRIMQLQQRAHQPQRVFEKLFGEWSLIPYLQVQLHRALHIIVLNCL